MNVLIVNAYSARNRGDGMIVGQMVRLFQERGCTVKVMSDDPDDGERYGVERLESLAPIWPTSSGGPSKAAIVFRLMRDAIRPGDAEPFRWADLCVSAGGGYLYDDGGRTSRLNLARRLLPLRAARRAGVPVVLFSQSIGPFESDWSARLVARVLRRCELVIVREERSAEVCRSLRVWSVLCDDVAFALAPAEPPGSAPGVSARTVGVTVMSALPGVDAAGHRRYLDALARGLELALADRHEAVAVISQVSAHRGDDDVGVASELAARLAGKGIVSDFVDLGEVSDEELSAFYGQLAIVVASRLHSGILALCAGTPIVALSYLPKTDGVLDRLALGPWVLAARELEARKLAQVIIAALEQEDALRAQIAERLPSVRASAVEAIDRALEAAAGQAARG